MKINIKRINDEYGMEAINEEGNRLLLDNASNNGEPKTGMSPMQLILTAVGGCSAIDVLLILKKQKQVIESFEVEIDGNKEKIEDYSLFKDICLHFKMSGSIDADKAERAVKLSLEKYCSVSKILEPTANISYKITID
jgi:putative redox protein